MTPPPPRTIADLSDAQVRDGADRLARHAFIAAGGTLLAAIVTTIAAPWWVPILVLVVGAAVTSAAVVALGALVSERDRRGLPR